MFSRADLTNRTFESRTWLFEKCLAVQAIVLLMFTLRGYKGKFYLSAIETSSELKGGDFPSLNIVSSSEGDSSVEARKITLKEVLCPIH